MAPGVGFLNWPRSMLAWDVIVLNGYITLNSVIPFYILFSHFRGKSPKKFYVFFMYVSVFWAVSIHMVTAFLLAEAVVVVPFRYFSLIFAALFGYLIFGDVPGLAVLAGAAVVVASGLYIFQREAYLVRLRRGSDFAGCSTRRTVALTGSVALSRRLHASTAGPPGRVTGGRRGALPHATAAGAAAAGRAPGVGSTPTGSATDRHG